MTGTQLSDKLKGAQLGNDSSEEHTKVGDIQGTKMSGDSPSDQLKETQVKDTENGSEKVKETEVSCENEAGDGEEDKVEDTPELEIVHEVAGSETLNSIAASYATTPSPLAQHNKLTSRLIFPGQKLRIPPEEKKEVKSEVDSKKDQGCKGRKMEKAKAVSYPEEPEMIDSQFVRVNV